jgi:hypothetical protein
MDQAFSSSIMQILLHLNSLSNTVLTIKDTPLTFILLLANLFKENLFFILILVLNVRNLL